MSPRERLAVALAVAALISFPPPTLAGVELASMEESPPVSGGYSDTDLEVEIENALVHATGVSLTGVEVEARNGFVTLSGTVDSEAARLKAAAISMETGATGVRNLLRVGGP